MSSIDIGGDEDRTFTPKVTDEVLNKALKENGPQTPQDKLELLRAQKSILRVKIDNIAAELETGEKRGRKSNMEMNRPLGKDVKTMTTDEIDEEIQALTQQNAQLQTTYNNLRSERNAG